VTEGENDEHNNTNDEDKSTDDSLAEENVKSDTLKKQMI